MSAQSTRKTGLPIASRPSQLDRASHLRTTKQALDSLFAQSFTFEVSGGKVAVTPTGLELLPSKDIDLGSSEKFFLGISNEDQRPYFAIHREEPGENFQSLREVAHHFAPLDLELAMHAIALSNWHHAHPRCSRCGASTRVDLGGAVRVCDVDQMQHHPRTDSAVIVLVRDRSDRILLGHQPVWPEGRYSTFAGFLEPGETFEQCVIREVREESGVEVSEMEYLGSQPWPFPASIMIAFAAITDNPTQAKADGEEIADVKWFTRDQLKSEAAAGTLLLPPTVSVARQMIEMWLGEAATGGETWR